MIAKNDRKRSMYKTLKESCNFLCIKSVLQRLLVSCPACKEMGSSHSHLHKKKAELKINYFHQICQRIKVTGQAAAPPELKKEVIQRFTNYQSKNLH